MYWGDADGSEINQSAKENMKNQKIILKEEQST